MTKQDRNDLRNEAKNGGLDAAIFRKLGCVKEAKAAGNKCPVGWEAAYYGIKDEVERHVDDDTDEAPAGGEQNPAA